MASDIKVDPSVFEGFQLENVADMDKTFMQEIGDITDWVNSQYRDYFGDVFSFLDDLSARFQSEYVPVSDSDLERIMTDLPLMLIDASERLNAYKLKSEAIKLKIANVEYAASEAVSGGTKQERDKYVKVSSMNYKLLQCAYSSLIDLVDRKLVYSKELIMGAKKVWTDRKQADPATIAAENPDSGVDSLPEYKTYIK